MDEVITFTVRASTNRVGSNVEDTIDIDREDLEGVKEEDWDDYVWEHLGGKEVIYNLLNMDISHSERTGADE